MTDDDVLITRFEPVMLELLPAVAAEEPVEVHAEVLHALCLAEGLLEVLEWSAEGTGADPLALIWLSALRWHRIMTGRLPEAAPEPPPRPTDHALGLLVHSGAVSVRQGTADAALTGLASGEMAYPSEPAQPGLYDEAVLTRVTPLGLVPYIDAGVRADWARQAVSLTHGHPELIEAAQQRVEGIAAAAERPGRTPQQHGLLGVVVENLAQRWRKATAG